MLPIVEPTPNNANTQLNVFPENPETFFKIIERYVIQKYSETKFVIVMQNVAII